MIRRGILVRGWVAGSRECHWSSLTAQGKGRHFMKVDFCLPGIPAQACTRETSVPVFVFHYLLVIMGISRKERVARALQMFCLMSLLLKNGCPGFGGNGKCGEKLQAGGPWSQEGIFETTHLKRKLEECPLLQKEVELLVKGKKVNITKIENAG